MRNSNAHEPQSHSESPAPIEEFLSTGDILVGNATRSGLESGLFLVQVSDFDSLTRSDRVRAMIRTERILRKGISKTDVLYRCGRDGFVVLSTRAESHEIAYLARTLRAMVEKCAETDGPETKLLLAAARPESSAGKFDDLLRTAHQNLCELRTARAAA